MILLELDPNIVKPGWTPLLILIGLGLVMALLFRSMRRQFRRVDDRWPEEAAAARARREAAEVTDGPARPGSPGATTGVLPPGPVEGPSQRG